MMLRYLILLLLLPLAHAEVVAPTIYEQKDLGPVTLEQFTYSISVDCTAAAISVIVMDSENKPVRDANNYLKYIDFAQPLISTSSSDKDGRALHKLPGNVKLMRGFFILVIQKKDFRNKEIHFDIGRCYLDDVPVPPIPSQPAQPEPSEPVNQTGNVTQPNVTINVTNISSSTNVTNETAAEEAPAPEICPLALLVPLLMFYKRNSFQYIT